MTQLAQMLPGLGTPTTGGTNSSSPTPVSDSPDLTALLSGTSIAGADVPLSGGTFDPSAPGFNPELFTSGGQYGPTGGLSTLAASAPQISSAIQDPSAQIPDTQQVDRTLKGDFQGPQTVDRTGKSDLASALGLPPPGPTGLTSDQPATRGIQAAGAAGPQGAGTPPEDVRQRGLQSLQRQAAAQAAQAPLAPDQPAAPAPAAVSPQPTAGQQQQQQAPSAPPAQRLPAAAAPTPQQVLNRMGMGTPPLTLANLIPYLLSQLFGFGRPGMPGAPVAPSGQFSPAARRRLGLPPSTADRDTGIGQPEASTPTPGSNAAVSAPTQAQIRQTVLAGTDTPPTAGFSSYLANQRSRFARELQDPRVRREVAAIAAAEHGQDPAAVVESLMNRAAYAGTSLSSMIHSGFYGPVNKGQLPRWLMNMQRNPTQAAKMNAGIETALRGSNLLGGATDQGSGNDPNVGHRGGRVRRFGEVYNDWGGGPGGHAGAARWRHEQQERVRFEMMDPKYQQAHNFGQALAMNLTPGLTEGGGPELEGGNVAPRGGAAGSAIRGSVTPDPGQLGRVEDERRKRQQRQEAIAL